MKYALINGFCILIFLISLPSCRVLKEPQFRSIENLSIENIGASGSILSMDMNFFNPNKTGVKLKKVEADVYLNDTFLGHFRTDSLLRLKRKAEFALPVKLSIDLKNMLKYSLLILQNEAVVLKLNGKAKIGKAFIYVQHPFRYEGTHAISDFIK